MEWVPAAILCSASYFVSFSFSESSSLPGGYVLNHLGQAVQGLLLSFGSTIVADRGSGTTVASHQAVTEICGFHLLLGAAAILFSWLRSRRPRGARGFCIGLILTTVLFEFLLIPGRLSARPSLGTASRYDTFSLPLLLGIDGYSAVVLMGRRPRNLGAASLSSSARDRICERLSCRSSRPNTGRRRCGPYGLRVARARPPRGEV